MPISSNRNQAKTFESEGSPRRSPRRASQRAEGSSPRANAGGGFFFARSATTGSSVRTPLNLVGLSTASGPQSSRHRRGGAASAPHGDRFFPAPAGILPELATPQSATRLLTRGHRARLAGVRPKGGSLVPSPPPASLNLINSVAGDALLFSETNMDWTKLNIFRTRLCDRLTQTHNCHMANRCLFSHDVNWPRRTPFLPRATALTLRYIPVWCPRLSWPPLIGFCDSSGKISWTSAEENWNARLCHQKCTRGDNCPFVHNVEEFLYHPEVYKTRSCCLANDDNFEEQMNSHCVALCPWYFCPFAHDMYELRNLREARFAWHAPPQIVDDDHVARTQDFDELEKKIIEFVRRHGSLDLYASPDSPLARCWRERMPPVIRPLAGSSLEQLSPSLGHRHSRFDDLLHLMVVASFLNLLLYPVENFYVPTLLSLQCAVLQSQLGLTGSQTVYDCATLLRRFADEENTSSPRRSAESAKTEEPPTPPTETPDEAKATAADEEDLKAILDLLNSTKTEDLLQMMALLQDADETPAESSSFL